jgi:hypothetical protein
MSHFSTLVLNQILLNILQKLSKYKINLLGRVSVALSLLYFLILWK